MKLILLIAAVIVFILAMFNVSFGINMIALGLALGFGSMLPVDRA